MSKVFDFTVAPQVGPAGGGEDLADAIELLASGVYSVTRRGVSVYDANGRLGTPTQGTFETLGLLHPLKGLELQRLPENLRNREVMAFFTRDELHTVDHTEPDSIYAEGAYWEVQTVERWQALGNFFRCLVARKP